MNSGKLLKISNERSIYIIENEDGNYINEEMLIRYRNIGAKYERAIIVESYCFIDEKGMLNITNNIGDSILHFPLIWLDTDRMKLQSLIEKEYIKIN